MEFGRISGIADNSWDCFARIAVSTLQATQSVRK